jgi:hypothetical protein
MILIGGHRPRGVGELEVVHRPRHVEISEDDADVPAGLKFSDRVVGVRRLDDIEAGLFDHTDRGHPDEGFVLTIRTTAVFAVCTKSASRFQRGVPRGGILASGPAAAFALLRMNEPPIVGFVPRRGSSRHALGYRSGIIRNRSRAARRAESWCPPVRSRTPLSDHPAGRRGS